jgi:hypothetical protein
VDVQAERTGERKRRFTAACRPSAGMGPAVTGQAEAVLVV